MSQPKLHSLTRGTFQLPIHVASDHSLIEFEGGEIPLIKWPDGRWCLPANLYMLALHRRGLSTRNGGGTLAAYASNITHLLRFCAANTFSISRLTDAQFSFFMKTLAGQQIPGASHSRTRSDNTSIAIGHTCLDFLEHVGRLYLRENYVGPDGDIRATRKTAGLSRSSRHRSQRSGNNYATSWHHHSFPTPNPIVRRLPISSDTIEKLREAVCVVSKSIYQRKRRFVLLKLLEITGGRRAEIAEIRVSDVIAATRMPEPRLKLITLKRRGRKVVAYREIPISRHDLAVLMEFIEKNRRKIIRATTGTANDCDRLLVNENTGQGLKPNTITQELSLLAKAAGIEEQSCPQLFRHRFITKLFVALIEQHDFENVDSFRKALLETEALKEEVSQWTGHSWLISLDNYIHLAFKEVANFKKTVDIVRTRNIVDSASATVTQLQHEIRNGVKPSEIADRLKDLLAELKEDLPP